MLNFNWLHYNILKRYESNQKIINKIKVFFLLEVRAPGHWTVETNKIKIYNTFTLFLQKIFIYFCKNVEALLYI